jgi:hypothetical protein
MWRHIEAKIKSFAITILIRDKNVLLRPEDYAGRPIVNFRNVAIGVVDQLLDTEAPIS